MNKAVLGTIAANALIGMAKSSLGSKSFMETGVITMTVSDRYDAGSIRRDNEDEKPLVMTKADILDCISRIKDIQDYIEENGRGWFVQPGEWGDTFTFFNFAGFADFDYEGWDVSYHEVENLILPSDIISFEQYKEGSDMVVTASFTFPITKQTLLAQIEQFSKDIHILFQVVLAHLNTKKQNERYIVEHPGVDYCNYDNPVILESNPREDKFPLDKNIKTSIRRF